jgi:hypothetical protein
MDKIKKGGNLEGKVEDSIILVECADFISKNILKVSEGIFGC